jgi:hypothetical protein
MAYIPMAMAAITIRRGYHKLETGIECPEVIGRAETDVVILIARIDARCYRPTDG